MSENRKLWIGTVIAAAGLSFYGGYALNSTEGLKMAADTSSNLAKLSLDSEILPIAGSHARGSDFALVTAVAFVDYQSPASRVLLKRYMDDAVKAFGSDNLRLVYKAYPLATNAAGIYAAKAVYAAAEQGKFWEMNDAILAGANEKDDADIRFLTIQSIESYAQNIGLDLNKFNADIESDAIALRVQRDIDLGKSLNLTVVPTIFLNGKRVEFDSSAMVSSTLTASVEDEMRRMQAIRGEMPNVNYYLGTVTNGLTKDMLTKVDNLGRPVRGNSNALVTIVEYSDYECPYCVRVEPTLAEILKRFPNDVRIVFAHNPLPFHAKAQMAHQATWAAQKQGKFWEMHDAIFKNPRAIAEADLLKLAKSLNLDMNKFQADWKSDEAKKAIDDSIKEGSEKGISGTPSFLINGELLTGAQPLEKFSTLINKKLTEARLVQRRTLLEGEALYHEIMKSAPTKALQAPQDSASDRMNVAIGNAPILGKMDAPVTVVEFSDFECPFCSRAHKTVGELLKNNPDSVRVVFKHYPLSFHKNAKLAHQAAEAAHRQGKFWEYSQVLFDNQKALDRDSLIGYAKGFGLDINKFISDMDSSEVVSLVEADIAAGNAVAVKGTPHFFINGTRISGAQPIAAFQSIVDSELSIAKKYLDSGTPANQVYDAVLKGEIKAAPKPAQIPQNDTIIVPPIEGSPSKGLDSAPVTIIQFSEFQCPFCSKVEPTIEELLAAYPGKIKIVFKQFPLDFHADAPLAAQASLAAFEQGKFWEMHRELFANQKALKRADLEVYAAKIGLDMTKFKQALDSSKFKAQVEEELAQGKAATVLGTPSFLINGELLVGAQPLDKFKQAVDRALGN